MTRTQARTPAVETPRWQVQFDRACDSVLAGRSREAIAPLRIALKLNPDLTPGWRLLSDILMAAGDFADALRADDRAVRSTIRDPRLRASVQAVAEQRLGDAERDLGDILVREPAGDPLARQLLGELLRRRSQTSEAERILRRCLEAAPRSYEPRMSLARVFLSDRRFAEAIAEFDRLMTDDPSDCRSLAMKAAALAEIGRHGEAAILTAAVVNRFPDQPYARLVHAHGLRALGQSGDCIAAYLACIELDRRCAEAWLSLANLKTYRFTPEQFATMEALLAQDDLRPADRAKLHFALGKADEDSGAHAKAFENYARANAIERTIRAYDPAQTHAYVQRSKVVFTPGFFAARPGGGARAPDPIFIVGLPRSGSTLVEQILASHPAIEGTHELPDLPILAAGVEGYPEGLARLSRDTCSALGAEYLRRTSAYRHLGRPRFIDKTPKNFLHIGFIRLILPNARIVDVRRHPLDCGLSIFRQHFGLGFGCAFDLDHIGRYYADYVDLMAHFDTVAPGVIHRVIYEDLVEDTERETRLLLAYLGLPFDPACLRFFDNPRAVETPSSEQVRQPIFASAIDQWRRYEPWLGPLKDALGPVLNAYPSAPV